MSDQSLRVYGINPVLEALKAGRVERLSFGARQLGLADGGEPPSAVDLARLTRAHPRMGELLALASARQVPYELLDAPTLDRLARGGVHQGVVAAVTPAEAFGPADLVRQAAAVPLIVVLDGIEDPHNVGAILRTADAVGADGVIRQARRAAPLEGAAAKASAGAVAHVRVATVVNIARAIEELKQEGVWTIGLDAGAPRAYDEIDLTLPSAIVLGAEGSGLRRLVRERCDWVVSIPMAGHVSSLNVSVAAGIVLFEAARQRRPGVRGGPASGRPGG